MGPGSWPMPPARSGCTSSVSFPATVSWWSYRPMTSAGAASPTASDRRDHEGIGIGQTTLRQVQSSTAQGRRPNHLLEPPPQAEAGVGGLLWLGSPAVGCRGASQGEVYGPISLWLGGRR